MDYISNACVQITSYRYTFMNFLASTIYFIFNKTWQIHTWTSGIVDIFVDALIGSGSNLMIFIQNCV